MEDTRWNFSMKQLLEELEGIQPKNRLFRIYAHSPSLFDLLLTLEQRLSGSNGHHRITPDDKTWMDLLKSIRSLCTLIDDRSAKENMLFHIGQIAMLLDCIRSRDAHMRSPNLVRLFI